MKHNIISLFGVLLLTVGLTSCADESLKPEIIPSGKTAMNFTFSHPSQSRATETSFETGDVVGLFVSESGRPLEIAGNTVNNEGAHLHRRGMAPLAATLLGRGHLQCLRLLPACVRGKLHRRFPLRS